jgi:CRP/FNR family transcriptional regulator, cyclic AMP receptor protein
METVSQFSHIPIFSGLSEEEHKVISENSLQRSYQPGQYLAHAGDIWPYLFFISQGRVIAVKESMEGRSLVATTLKAGEIFWGVSFFHPELPMPVALQVEHPTTALLWSREQMLPVILGNGKFAWELSRLMVARMLRASEIVEELAFQPVAGRLARLLMDYPGRTASGPISRSLTLDNMAARIGTTREMVCRLLQRFADDEVIRITRTEFEITDRERLVKMTQKERG